MGIQAAIAAATIISTGVSAASQAGAFGEPEIEELPDPVDPNAEETRRAREEAERKARRRRGFSSTILTQEPALGDVSAQAGGSPQLQ